MRNLIKTIFNILAVLVIVCSSHAVTENNDIDSFKFSTYKRSLERESGCILVGHKNVLHLDLEENASTNLSSKADDSKRVIALLTGKGDYHIKRTLLKGKLTVIQYKESIGNEEDYCEELMKTGEFLYVEPNYSIAEAAIPNDPYYSPNQWHHTKINNPIAWNYETGNTSILVAVLDSGFETTHPDLAGNLQLPGYNAVDGSSDVSPALPPNNTMYPHGTKVAGCLGAIGNNASHVSGVVWTTRILPIKISYGIVNGSSRARTDDAVAGIDYARTHGARVVNLSYGFNDNGAVTAAAQDLRDNGGILVMSASNDGAYMNWPDTSSYIAVGATDQNDARASFSNWGEYIDVVAPGTDICTLDLNGGVTNRNGTSYSSPIVAGLVTLLWSYDPDLTPTEVENIIFDSCVDLGSPGDDVVFGHGRIDAGAALYSVAPNDLLMMSTAAFCATNSVP